MEDGVKEDVAPCQEPKFLGKAGWVKKAPGRLLATYKDRYVHVEKTEIVVYENEDLQNCLERLDLQSYDKCHELKSPFKRKHRLILIRSTKSGNKVHDVKFQAQTAEEKEAWIKALTDGINRAKNKVFDEVKVDESSNLEHVTRTRPKGNRNRRPPTRIHMKEVAVVSSDGIQRLDLDLENAIMPNGAHYANIDDTDTLKGAIKVPVPLSGASEAKEKPAEPNAEEGAQTEPEISPQKKVIKPPMPPSKEAKPSTVPEYNNDDIGPEKKVLKIPQPPSKEAKPCISPVEEELEAEAEKTSEKRPDAKKKTGPLPTPFIKPSSSSSMISQTEESQSRLDPHPPTPPSKKKKPSYPEVDPDQEVQGPVDENKGKEEDNKEETGTAVGTDEADLFISNEALTRVRDDESPTTEVQVFEKASEDTISSPCPLLTSKKNSEPHNVEGDTTVSQPNERGDHTAPLHMASDTSDSTLQAEEAPPKSEAPSVVVCPNDLLTDSLSLSPLLGHLAGEKKKKEEEKSVDSGQDSDDDSQGSESEDMLMASTAALKGSHADLDELDNSKDNVKIVVSLTPTQAATEPQDVSKVSPRPRSKPTPPLKPVKARSASIGDLLSDSAVCMHTRAVAGSDRSPTDYVKNLETEVALEMENTSKLLSRVSQTQNGADREGIPEDLLAKAMEKLKKADRVLREVKKLKLAKSSFDRKSW